MDTIQVVTNFEIGRRIVEHEQKGSERADYGIHKKNIKISSRNYSRKREYLKCWIIKPERLAINVPKGRNRVNKHDD
ncbi:MAG: hypothetical protein ABH952_11765 [Candidatus Omnitrophota bacterium]